jgi:hypothetical protein
MKDAREEFETLNLEYFNKFMGTNIKQGDSWQDICKEIDDADVTYFYMSMCPEDILDAIENEQEIADQLKLDLYNVEDMFFLATY